MSNMYNFAKDKWKRSEKVKWTLAAVLFLLGLVLRAVPGVSFSATLCWLLAAACVALTVLSRLARRHRVWRDLLYLARAGLAILWVVLVGIEVWVIHVGQRTPDESRPVCAVIVLGAGVNGTTPSVALQTRINAAADYLTAHPETTAVLSGGQGPGEDITEAQAMYNALTAAGIDPDRLILEEASTNTRENLENSLALLPDVHHSTIAIVTNDFHMARVRLLMTAHSPGGVEQVPAELPWWWLSANYYVRETFAIVKDALWPMG